MDDFGSSYDSGEEATGGFEADSVDISETGSKVDTDFGEGYSIDISDNDENMEVDVSTETGIDTEIDVANETENNSFVPVGDSDIDSSSEFSIDETVDSIDTNESNSSSTIEVDTEKNDIDSKGENAVETEEGLKEYLEQESTYSMEVNKYISSPEELQVYKDAGLVETNVDGRICLIREDLDLDYVDKQSGLTNAELIAKGRAPYDAKTGERIELHHIGQDFNAPFAELKSASEHDVHSKTLHKSETESWRRDSEKVSQYSTQRKAHWKNRI